MKQDFDNTIFVIIILLAAAAAIYIFGGHDVFGQPPTTIIGPDGSATFVYPGQHGGPTTVVPPSGMPTYVYPGQSPGAPTTIVPPSGMPSYAYPPVGSTPSYSSPEPLPYQSNPHGDTWLYRDTDR